MSLGTPIKLPVGHARMHACPKNTRKALVRVPDMDSPDIRSHGSETRWLMKKIKVKMIGYVDLYTTPRDGFNERRTIKMSNQ